MASVVFVVCSTVQAIKKNYVKLTQEKLCNRSHKYDLIILYHGYDAMAMMHSIACLLPHAVAMSFCTLKNCIHTLNCPLL